jgi:glucosamine--fructose-6-phosphate aminotransferase (isomerizing)
LATPSLFTIYRKPPRLGNTLVIGVSQSGESPDVVEVVGEARRQGCRTLAITNAATSPLAAASEHQLVLGIPSERAVAATGTYTATLLAFALLSAAMRGSSADIVALRRIPHAVEETVADAFARIGRIRSDALPLTATWTVLGRGFCYGTGFETALKLKEVAQVAAESSSPADFLHGPIAAAGRGSAAMLIAPRGRTLPEMKVLASRLIDREVSVVAASNDDGLVASLPTAFRLPRVPEWLSPLTAIVPGQVMALEMARRRGLDPDRPRALEKITRTF